MADPASLKQFDKLCLEILKAIGKTLGQMGLYSPSHPSVRAMQAETVRMLGEILAQSPEHGLVFSIDQDKVIVNGRVIGQATGLPSSIPNLFVRFHLNSLAFTAGIAESELGELCSLAALKPDAAKQTDPKKYLEERHVSHVIVNEVHYAKVDRGAADSAPADVTAPSMGGGGGRVDAPPVPEAPGGGASDIIERLNSISLEEAIKMLVERAAADPEERRRIFQIVMQRVQEDLEAKVVQATQELRRIRTSLENQQARTSAVFGQVAEGVIVVDDQGKVLMMNANAEEMMGTRLVDAAGKPLEGNVKEEHLLALAKDITTPEDRKIDPSVKAVGKDDVRQTLRASAAVVQNEAGKPVGMVSSLSDVTKYREVQRMEREFIAHVTHELRAPLSSIRAALEILNGMFSGKLQEDESRMLANAMGNTDRLEGLVNEILDFSKIEAGQMTVHTKACNPEDMAREAFESLKPWAIKKSLQLNLDVQPGLPPVTADHARTVQVMVNLLSNAIKFTRQGGSVIVRVHAGMGDRSRFVIYSVKDTGPGIAKENQKKIFEKFVQIAMGEKHVGGTGLGLAIAKALVHMQKGQMWLDSDEGKGAEFFFTLPYHEAPAGSRTPKAAAPRRPWWKRLLGLK